MPHLARLQRTDIDVKDGPYRSRRGTTSASGIVAGLWLAGLLLGALVVPSSGCQGPATEDDLQLWMNNDRGLQRLLEMMGDPEEPVSTKVRALEIMVERGLPRRVRAMIDATNDAERKEVVSTFKAVLLKLLEDPAKANLAADAKDALLMMERYFTDAEFVEVQQRVAKWAFAGIDWKSTSDDVQKLGERISTGQIMDLGQYSLEGAAIVMSHGFKVDKMIAFLLKPLKKGDKEPSPDAKKYLLRAMKLLHQRIGAQKHHLDALSKIPSPDTAQYLYDLYLNPDVDEQMKNAAFNYADRMLKDPAVKGSRDVIEKVFKLFTASADPDDRWTATNYLVQMSGTQYLERALTYFKDDKKYNQGEADAARQVLDLCLDIYDRKLAEASRPIWRKLASDANTNRITKAMGIVCMKAHRDFSAIPVLEAMAKSWEKKEKPEEQLDLDDFLGDKITMKILINNALQGLRMLQGIKAEYAAKKLNDVEYEFKQRGVIFPLEVVGEEFVKRVANDWAEWQAAYKKNPKEFEDEVRGPKKGT